MKEMGGMGRKWCGTNFVVSATASSSGIAVIRRLQKEFHPISGREAVTLP